jgi:hypothetical protein
VDERPKLGIHLEDDVPAPSAVTAVRSSLGNILGSVQVCTARSSVPAGTEDTDIIDEVTFSHQPLLKAAVSKVEDDTYGCAAEKGRSEVVVVGAEGFLVGNDDIQVNGDAHKVTDAELVEPAAADSKARYVVSKAGSEKAADPEIEGRIPISVEVIVGKRVHESPHTIQMELEQTENGIFGEPVVLGIGRLAHQTMHGCAETYGRVEPVTDIQLSGRGRSGEIQVVIYKIATDAGSDEPVVLFLCLGRGRNGQQGQRQGKGIYKSLHNLINFICLIVQKYEILLKIL